MPDRHPALPPSPKEVEDLNNNLRRYIAHPGIPAGRHEYVWVDCPTCGERYVMAYLPERMPRCDNNCGPLQPADN